MSNEEFEKTIKEYNEQKNEQLKRDTLNNFHKKNDDRESVWKRSDEIKYGFENEYCTDSLKKERSEQHRNENTKRACKQIKKKKFKNTIISPELKTRIKKIAIGTSIIGIGIGAIAGFEKIYELGVNNGKSELIQEVSKTQLVRYNLNTAPAKIIECWADAEIGKFDQATQNNDSLRDVFNSILENEYGNVKSAYYEYIETELDDTFLKVKTSLFITPDFIIGKNPSKWEIMRQLAAKRKALFSKEYLFCENCLMQDHDVAIHEKPEKCPICGSKNIRMIYHENA